MQVVFGHDHKFRLINGEYYSTGGLSNEILSRYAKYFGRVIVVARVVNEDVTGENYTKITNSDVKIINRNLVTVREIKKIVKKSDCVISRLPSKIGSELVSYCNNIKPCFVEMVACPWDSLSNHSIRGKIIAPFAMYFTKIQVKNAEYVLYVTNEFLQKRYPTKGKQLGCSDVCLEEINPEILANRIEHIKKNSGKYIIGTTAAVDVKYKGQEFVIKALSILQKRGITNFEYQLVGNGSQERLKQIAKKYGVEDKVIYLGGKPHDKVFEWLDSIDIYIQPSLQEGLPRALVEAQSRALPCCGSSTGGIPELLLKECVFDKKGDLPLTIANWLQDFTDEKAIEYATWNFNNSKNYQSDILAAKRDAFYREFIEYVERGKE